jgi:hypothetical protein
MVALLRSLPGTLPHVVREALAQAVASRTCRSAECLGGKSVPGGLIGAAQTAEAGNDR